MENFGFIFPFIFIVIWIFTMFIVSKMGWSKLAEHYKNREEFHGNKLGINSVSIGLANYNNSIILRYNEEGLYLKPMLFFGMFHPALFIPWREITSIKEKKILFSVFKEIHLGSPHLATIKLKKSTFNKIEKLKSIEQKRAV